MDQVFLLTYHHQICDTLQLVRQLLAYSKDYFTDGNTVVAIMDGSNYEEFEYWRRNWPIVNIQISRHFRVDGLVELHFRYKSIIPLKSFSYEKSQRPRRSKIKRHGQDSAWRK